MKKNNHPLADIIRKIFPENVMLKSEPLNGGMSAHMQVVNIKDQDGEIKQIVIRQPSKASIQANPLAAHIEFKLLEFLHKQGIPVPKVYGYQASSEINSQPLLLLEYIPGAARYPLNPEKGFAIQLANTLANIHQLPWPTHLLSLKTPPLSPLTLFSETGLQDYNPFLQEQRIRDILRKKWSFIEHLNQACLIHGDFWHGNILWKNQRITGIIDWEDARISNPLVDLAITRLDLCWISEPKTMQQFTETYQEKQDLDYAQLPYWDLFAALRLIRLAGKDLEGWVSFFHPYGRNELSVQSFITNFNGFIDQALTQIQ